MSNDSNQSTARAIKFVGILAVLVIMALTNPSKADYQAVSHNQKFEVANFLIFSFCYPDGDKMAFGIFGHVYY